MSVVVRIEERRAAVRVEPLHLGVLVSGTDPDGAYPGDEALYLPSQGKVVNVSTAGLLVRVDQEICPGSRVSIAVCRPGGGSIQLTGQVVRTRTLARQRGNLVALRLSGVGGRTRRALEQIVQTHVPRSILN